MSIIKQLKLDRYTLNICFKQNENYVPQMAKLLLFKKQKCSLNQLFHYCLNAGQIQSTFN